MGNRLAEDMTPPRRSRTHDQPERCGGGFGPRGISQKEKRPTGLQRPAMQPARGGDVQAGRHSARLKENGAKPVKRGGLLGDPQCVHQPRGARDKQAGWMNAMQEEDSGRIGAARLTEILRRADPEKRQGGFLGPPAGDRQRESRCRSRIICAGGMDFREAGGRQPAGERRIETLRTR